MLRIRHHVMSQEWPDRLQHTLGLFRKATDNDLRAWMDQEIGVFYRRHMLARKMLIQEKIRSSIESGTNQIIFLGGGYDARGYCTAKEYEHVTVFEVDKAETIDIKRNLFAKELADNPRIHFLGINLEEKDLLSGLQMSGFMPEQKTLIIAEGFTMYLKKANLIALLTNIQNWLSSESEILISFNRPKAHRSEEEQQLLKNAGEEMFCSLLPEEVIPFCNDCNYFINEYMPMHALHGIFGEEFKDEILNQMQKSGAKGEDHFVVKSADKKNNTLSDIPIMPCLNAFKNSRKFEFNNS